MSCKYHLFLDVTKAGSLKLNFPAASLDGLVDKLSEMKETCALDVAGGNRDLKPDDATSADGDGVTLEEVGALMNVTRERIRQMEEKFKRRLTGDPAVRSALGISDDDYWRTGKMPPMLPAEAGRRLRESKGHENAALLEVPDDLFEDVVDETAPDRSSGVRVIGNAEEVAVLEPERHIA